MPAKRSEEEIRLLDIRQAAVDAEEKLLSEGSVDLNLFKEIQELRRKIAVELLNVRKSGKRST